VRQVRGIQISALVVLAALSLLASACGGSGAAADDTAAARQSRAVAFSRCMRSHGVPSFPDPRADGSFPSFQSDVSKQVSVAANEACKHLLPSGGSATPQERQQKVAFALHVARCLRAHGYPAFPDPTSAGQRVPPGIDTSSPRFQAAETGCESAARKALGLP
jgi:hypothetical protein